jgi:hypothetical protein
MPPLPTEPLTLRRIARTWWPLAGSWLLIAAEMPTASAAVARLANPEIHLAAYGGIVMPLALIVEAPIIMLLSASTALSRDWASYRRLRSFMLWAGAGLTALHLAIALTPLYYVVARQIIGAPPEILEPGRLGLVIMAPWSWAIANRRFNQGVLIRFDQSRSVALGTLFRFGGLALGLAAGILLGALPGVAVAAGAVILGVVSESLFIGWRVRPIVRDRLLAAPAVQPALTWRGFAVFYVPLVMTAMLMLGSQPVVSAALSRMPLPIESLAAWTVMGGLLFMLESLGLALNEVVVALLDEPGSSGALRRFTTLLAGVATGIILILAVTPLSRTWFGAVAGLAPPLADLARRSLWLALPIPGLAVLHSWFQGALLHSRRTRAITEAMIIFIVVDVLILGAGVVLARWPGLPVGLTAMTAGLGLQTAWLWWRSRPALRAVRARDAAPGMPHAAGAGAD